MSDPDDPLKINATSIMHYPRLIRYAQEIEAIFLAFLFTWFNAFIREKNEVRDLHDFRSLVVWFPTLYIYIYIYIYSFLMHSYNIIYWLFDVRLLRAQTVQINAC